MSDQLSGTAWLALIVFILLVGGIPFGIWFSLRRQNLHKQIDLLRKAGGRMTHPWAQEDAQIKELSQRVAELKDKKTQPPSK